MLLYRNILTHSRLILALVFIGIQLFLLVLVHCSAVIVNAEFFDIWESSKLLQQKMSNSTACGLLLSQRQEITRQVLEAKKAKNLTWEQIAEQLSCSPVFLASVCLGENSLDKTHSKKLSEILGVSVGLTNALCEFPIKAQNTSEILLQDPFLYRLHEATLVYGLPLKEVVQEKFGDGIMSAIDFMVDVEKIEDPKGDRVKITMNGKYLPYRKW